MPADKTLMQHRALNAVADGRVMWRQARPAEAVPVRSAGFAQGDGSRLTLPMLIAVCELHKAGLIVVDGAVVLLTSTGRQRLAEWDATRAGAR